MSGPERWWRQLRARAQAWTAPRVRPEHLHAHDATTRWRALRQLRGYAQPALLPAVLSLLEDEDSINRATAVDVLTTWGANAVLGPVQQMLSSQPQNAVAAAGLLTILAHMPAPANRDFITPWLQSEQPETKAAAFGALAALGDDADLPQLATALNTEATAVRRGILAHLCAPAGESILQNMTFGQDPILQQLATQARARIHKTWNQNTANNVTSV